MAVRLVIRGRVQGVFFRDWAVREARRLGLAGWVRNLGDGAVEVVAEGGSEAVEAFVGMCHAGPEAARVERVDRSEVDVAGLPPPFARRGDG